MPSMDGEPWPPCGATAHAQALERCTRLCLCWGSGASDEEVCGRVRFAGGESLGGGDTLAREKVKIASHTPKSLMHLGQGERLSSSMKGQVATPRTVVKSKFATVSESKGTSFERPAPHRMQC